MNLLAAAAQYLADAQKRTLGIPVLLKRSGGEQESFVVRVKTTLWDVDAGDGRIERWESRSFIFDPADLSERPREGDTIYETHPFGTATYRVMSPPGQPPVHYSDSYRTGLVVHTKLVAQA